MRHIERSIAELREIASSAASGETVMALAGEVQALGARIDDMVNPAARDSHLLSELDLRFRDLLGQFTSPSPDAAPVRPADPVLDAISSQLNRLTERLDGFVAPDAEAFDDAEPRSHDSRPPLDPSESERRTQDTLDKVHEALERVVERLSAVEMDIRAGGRPAAGPATQPISALESLNSPSIAPAQSPPTHPLAAMLAPASERRPIDPTLPADHPLEPNTAGRSRAASAAERIAASEAALGNAKPAPETDAKANFIAAARRAAQAAANAPALADESEPAPAGTPNRLVAMARKVTGRKPLMLGIALLVIAGSLHLALNVWGHGSSPPDEASKPAAAASPASIAGRAPSKISAATRQNAEPAQNAIAASFESTGPQTQPGSAFSVDKSDSEANRGETHTTPGISPLTIASIQMPTVNVSRPTGAAGRRAAGPAETAAVSQEPTGSVSPNLRNAALAGDPAAEYEMGTRFADGRGVPVNFEEAARWLDMAAKHDIAPAQYRLGSLYEKGQGVKKDLVQASRLYQAAAIKGHAKAMHNLAVLHADGMDGKPNFKMAAEWFRKAAARGVGDSQYNLAILCARGLGVDQDLGESYKWFALATAQGDHDAGAKRDDIAGRLDPAALAKAKAAVESFVVEPQPAEATMVKAAADGPAAPAAKPRLPRKIGPT